MKLPAGVVKKRGRYFARIHAKGGEKSFPLGPDPGAAAALFYQVKAAVLAGKDPREVQSEEAEPEPEQTVKDTANRWLAERIDPELEARNAQCIRSRVEGHLLPFLDQSPSGRCDEPTATPTRDTCAPRDRSSRRARYTTTYGICGSS